MQSKPRQRRGLRFIKMWAAADGEKENSRAKAREFWSGLRGSNPLPPPWQGGALPNELNPHGERKTGNTAPPTSGEELAIRMGLEPTTSAVTGRRSNQLNYRTVSAASARLIIIPYKSEFCKPFFKKSEKNFRPPAERRNGLRHQHFCDFPDIIPSSISQAECMYRRQGRTR